MVLVVLIQICFPLSLPTEKHPMNLTGKGSNFIFQDTSTLGHDEFSEGTRDHFPVQPQSGVVRVPGRKRN